MADYAPLVLVSGVRQQLQAADRVLANGMAARTGTNLALVADALQLVTISAGVDLQFGAATDEIGSSGGMIQVQNLLDKTAAETITANWQHSANITFDTGARTIAGIENQNLVDKTADETITLGDDEGWEFLSAVTVAGTNRPILYARASGNEPADTILFQVQDNGGGNLFSVDTEGDVTIAGAETVAGASTVSGTANFNGDVNLGNGGDTITIGSGPTDDIIFNGPITVTIPDSGNFTGIYIDNNDPTTPSDAFRIDGAVANMVNVGEDDITLATSAGAIDVNSGGAVTLDAAAASNFTVTGSTLTLSNTGANELDITSGGLMDINAGSNLDIDVTGTFDLLASTTFSIDGTGASNVTATSGVLTLSTVTTGNLVVSAADNVDMDAGADILITAVDNVDIDSGVSGGTTVTGGSANLTLNAVNGGFVDIDGAGITIDATAGVSIAAATASNFTVTGATLTLSNTGANELDITSGGLLDINAGANLDIDVTGSFDMLASTTFAISGTGASSVNATSGTLTLSSTTTGDVAVDSAAEILFDDINRSGSTWLATSIKLSETTGEWNTFNTNFGEVSIFSALNQAYSAAGGAVQEILLQSLTTAGMGGAGEAAYLSANDTVLPADADSTLAAARVVGVYAGDAGQIVVQGRVDINITEAAVPAAGAPIYVSTTAGEGTAIVPSGPGEYITCIGYVVDNTAHSGAGDPVEIMLNIERPILI